MLEEKEIDIEGKTFIISKMPALAGREICTQYPISATPKLGDYKTNEAIMLKLMAFVAVPMENGIPLPLSNRALIDNHVPSWEVLLKLEWTMLEYNTSFFRDGRASTFFDDLAQKLPRWASKMLMGFSEQLSQKEKRPSTNSEPSTP